MKSRIKDISGQKFGEWLVIERGEKLKWKCQCSCGNIRFVLNNDLLKGKSQRCIQCAAKLTSKRLSIDLTGKKFGLWTVIERTGTTSYRRPIWKCLCNCGKIGYIPSGNLIEGLSTKCGNCNHHENIIGNTWTKILKGAESRNIPFDLTIDEANLIFENQNGKCALTGVNLTLRTKANEKCTASLDRIDNTLSYTKENCQWVHKDVNRMKWILSNDQFKEICKQVVEYHNL